MFENYVGISHQLKIRNRSIVNVDINLDQVVAEDNIRLRDRGL